MLELEFEAELKLYAKCVYVWKEREESREQ